MLTQELLDTILEVRYYRKRSADRLIFMINGSVERQMVKMRYPCTNIAWEVPWSEFPQNYTLHGVEV